MPLRCLVLDDHPAVAFALTGFLAEHGYEVVGPLSDGRRAVEAAAAARPELAIVDYRLPLLEGRELVERLAEAAPEMRIAVYTAEADARLAQEALAAGASAVVLKEAPLDDLTRALESILQGRRYVDPGIAPLPGQSAVALTARELEVLALLAEGLSHEQAGRRLGIGAETVRSHARKAAARLDAATRTQAVAAALRLGLIS